MSTTTDDAPRSRFDRFVRVLLRDEKLSIAPNATVAQLTAAFEAGVAEHHAGATLDDAPALMNWLVDRPEVEELLVGDPEFAYLLIQTHPAAPRVEGGARSAFIGMVVRAYELLVSAKGS